MTAADRRLVAAELAVVLGLLSLATLVLWPGVGRTYFYGDFGSINLPMRAYFGDAWRSGTMAWWTPELGGGYPLFAESEPGVLYLGNAAFALSRDPFLALTATLILHLAWGGLGVYCLLRSLALRRLPAFLGAAVFMLSGPSLFRMLHTNIFQGLSWLPWAMWGLELGLRRRWWGFVALGVALAQQILTGHPASSTTTALALGPYALLRGWTLPRAQRTSAAGTVGGLALAGALTVGLSAAQLLPLLELVPHTHRAEGVSLADRLILSLEPSQLWVLAAPRMFGTPFDPDVGFMFQVGSLLQWEWGAFIGVVPLLLVLVSPVLGRRPVRWLFLGIAALGLLLALGNVLPFYRWLSELPGYSSVRIPSRMLILFAFGAAAAVGLTLDDLVGAPVAGAPVADGWRRRAALGLSTAAIAAICVAMMALADRWLPQLPPARQEAFTGAWLRAAMLATVGALLVWRRTAWRAGGGEPWLALMAALLLLDLFSVAAGYHPTAPTSTFDPPANVAAVAQPGERTRIVTDGRYPNPYQANRNLLYADVHNLGANTTLALTRVLDAMAEVQRGLETGDPRVQELIGALRLSHVPAGWVDRQASEPAALVPSGVDPWPRAWAEGGEVPVVVWQRNRVAVRTRGVDGGLVLGRTPYPGWQVLEASGWRPARMRDELFLTAAPAGEVTRLVYRPLSIRFGLFVSLAALAGLVAAAVAGRAR